MFKWASIFFYIGTVIYASPPKEIPSNLYSSYTLNGQIPVRHAYWDSTYSSDIPIVYNAERINQLICQAQNRDCWYYGLTDTWLYTILDKYKEFIMGKTVGIIGSNVPWYESIILSYEGRPVTVEYNKILTDDPRLQLMTVGEYEQNPQQFDVILSISSIEHDGLGRYGDPINPSGDLEAMKKMKNMLKNGGLLFLAIPIGQDCLVWNAHRVYGRIRLPLLLQGWKEIDSCGYSDFDFFRDPDQFIQPVFVLQPLN